MRSFLQDVRYSIRSYSRTPGLAFVIILTLALGIGANTAIFTLINGVMLQSLPVSDAESLLVLGRGRSCCVNGGIPLNFDLFAFPQYIELREDNPYFNAIAAVRAESDSVLVRRPGSSQRVQSINARLVSGNYFQVLGVNLVAGRGFSVDDDRGELAHPLVVVGDGLAKRMFGSSTAAVGQPLTINGTAFSIVGVAPPSFFGETFEVDPAEMWIPLSMQPKIMGRRSMLADEGAFWLYPLARLKSGASIREAEAWLKTQVQTYLARTQGSEFSEKDREDIARVNVEITSGQYGFSRLRRLYSESLKMLMALVGLLLLICCANIANLLLARASARQHEIATRAALGARRWRIVRQMLTESMLLGMTGGLAGLFLAFLATEALLTLAFPGSTIPVGTVPDRRVLGFTFLVSMAATLACGFAPAWHCARVCVSSTSRTVTGPGYRRLNLGGALVIAQVSICLVLVVVAGLFTRSFSELTHQDFGFSSQVIDIRIDPNKVGYTFEQLPTLYSEIERRLARVPGVESVTLAQFAPFSGQNWSWSISLPGYASADGNPPSSRFTRVGPRFFETSGMRLIAGRDIGPQDVPGAPAVTVVNERFVREFLNNRDPLGVRFSFNKPNAKVQMEIVGVVSDAKFQHAREQMQPTFFLPMLQPVGLQEGGDSNDDSMYAHDILVRAGGDPGVVTAQLRAALVEMNPDMPIRKITTLREQVGRTLMQDLVVQKLSGFFGLLALLISAIGLYGLMSYAVIRRTRELGIRFALGAATSDVVRMVMRQSMLLVVLGIAIGVPLTWAGARIASRMLFGVGPYDAVVFITSTAILAATASISAYLPARRASRVDAAVVLRAE